MPGALIDRARVDAFWAAVAASSSTFVSDMIERGGAAQTAEFTAVSDRLAAVHPDLLLVVGGGPERPEIVVSAGGLRELFPVVLAVVDAAPSDVRERFDVRAFRPRVPDASGLRVRLKGRDIGAKDIHWDAKRQREDRTRCDLVLYVPGLIKALPVDSAANRPAAEAVFVLLDHLVGEWAVEAQIANIDWYPASEGEGLPTLLALPEYLDRISAG